LGENDLVTAVRPMLAVLDGQAAAKPPIWLMRQAGRYLSEYRALRKQAPNFLAFCMNPDMAIEATMQPIRRFGFDAAIIFSDILVIPEALDRGVHFVEGEGPRMRPITDPAEITTLRSQYAPERLQPVYAALRGTRAALPPETTLLGFCGAPWTIATYMIAGQGTKDQAPARLMAYRHPEAFQTLIDLIVEVSADYLAQQIDAGADAVQIFDSWAGVLPPLAFQRWCAEPIAALVARLRVLRPEARIMIFPRGGQPEQVTRLANETKAAVLSVDTTGDMKTVGGMLDPGIAIQGNLDPLALVAGGAELDAAIERILADTRGRKAVFNLGHGILPETPIAHVERLLARVRA
jgi:uroporphyrinogen decarboxylase